MQKKAVRYSITGMHCAACQTSVEKAVSRISGVDEVSVSLLTNSMTTEGDASPGEIIRAVKAAGYGAELMTEGADPGRLISDDETPALRKRLLSSIWLLIILMYISMGHGMLGLPLPSGMEGNPALVGFAQMALAAIIMMINGEFFTSGFGSLMRLAPNMDSLVALGSMTSFLWSVFLLYRLGVTQREVGPDAAMPYLHELFFESAAMIVTLITVGKLLEAMSRGKTTDAIKGLIELAPRTALVERDGKRVEIPVEEIKVGDVFVCRAGDNFPVDGVVIEGETSVDESALTGESVLVEKCAGDLVSAATVNMGAEIRAKATHVGEDTTLSQIIRMVSEASATRAPIARIADKVSGVFVPVVIGIAAAVILIWLLTGADAGHALSRGIAVLVISCPCALGLATPVAIMVGNGVGARNGILFKTARSLEQTGRVGIIALDKTGTITEGRISLGADTSGDMIKDDSRDAIARLRALGIKTVMLTGDKVETAKKIGDQAGIDDIAAGLMPQDKDKAVRELKGSVPVAMVGDGINDAPALTSADVGIAIGAGRDVAIDAADVVLMNSRLSDVVAAVRLSRATVRNIHQNLFWAFIYNILLIPLAAGAYTWLLHGWTLDPMIAAAAMSLSSFCVCMNALRLNLFDPHDSSGDRPLAVKGASDKGGGKSNDDRKINGIMSIGDKDDIIAGEEKEKVMKKTMRIEGMMCTHCETNVRKALEELEEVSSAEVSHEAGTAVVEMTSEVDDYALKRAVEERDYTVVSIDG